MESSELEQRRALLRAAGFAQIRVHHPPPELATLHRWLDRWSSIGNIAVGMARHGCDLSLTSDENGGGPPSATAPTSPSPTTRALTPRTIHRYSD